MLLALVLQAKVHRDMIRLEYLIWCYYDFLYCERQNKKLRLLNVQGNKMSAVIFWAPIYPRTATCLRAVKKRNNSIP